jgi:hypothetical protein
MGSTGTCTPNCTADTTCGCSATCNGHTYTMGCSQSTTTNCFCEIDGATQSASIVLDSCTMMQVQQAFVTQCLPN